jgi:hypothetical protein
MSVWADIHKRSNGVSLKKEKVIFKEMVYSNEREIVEIIARNVYKGVEYFVVNIGIHPCAYVVCEKEFLDKHRDEWGDIDGISVHGGVTYTGKLSSLSAFEGDPDLEDVYCFGWDYGHAGDWAGYLDDITNEGSRKYDTWMVVDECKSAIDQYLEKKEQDDSLASLTYTWSYFTA